MFKKTAVFLAVAVLAVTAFFLPLPKKTNAMGYNQTDFLISLYDNEQSLFLLNTGSLSGSIGVSHLFGSVVYKDVNTGEIQTINIFASWDDDCATWSIRIETPFNGGETYYVPVPVGVTAYTLYLRYVRSNVSPLLNNTLEFGTIAIGSGGVFRLVYSDTVQIVTPVSYNPQYFRFYSNQIAFGMISSRLAVYIDSVTGKEWTVPEIVSYFGYFSIARVTYDDGFEDGYTAGNSVGIAQGWGDGFSSGYDDGFEDGYDLGSGQGYNSGYADGEEDGYNDGYTLGQRNGYAEGQQIGYAEGHTKGVQKGYADADSATKFIPRIFSAVGSFFIDTLGGVSLFGISLWQVVLTLVSVALVAFFLKFII